MDEQPINIDHYRITIQAVEPKQEGKYAQSNDVYEQDFPPDIDIPAIVRFLNKE